MLAIKAFDLTEKEKLARQQAQVELRNRPLILHESWIERWNPYRWQAPRPRALTRTQAQDVAVVSVDDRSHIQPAASAVGSRAEFRIASYT